MAETVLQLQGATLDLGRRALVRDGKTTILTTKEAELLGYLAARAGTPVSRAELLAEVWGYDENVETRTLDVTIRRLRAKIEPDPAQPVHVLTQHGEGYRFVPAVAPVREEPAGQVTLVFTDIEGSTAKWERHGVAFHGALRAHDQIIRATLAEHGGYEVKTVGDAFVVAFTVPRAAVAFALAAQARLAAHDWGEVGQVRVRMGAHTGTPVEARDPVTGRKDWFGPVVNRAARVAEMAHGGQVIATGEVRRACAAVARWTELGAHEADGVEDAIAIWQADPLDATPGLFPPLRSRAAVPLPLPVDTFVGRVDALRELDRKRRAGTRFVTLVAPGGTGKTRLALEAARRFPAGRAAFVDLVDVMDEAGFCVRVGQALGQPAAAESVAQLGRAVAERDHLLLVLDNAEDLVGVVGAAVVAWLQAAPSLLILVTSRRPLRVPGEVRVDLGPLSVAEASELFLTRARAKNARFAANPKELAELVQALDGWPLAIELAASRAASLPVAALRKRLADRFAVLVGGTGPERHRSLQDVLDDAWEELTPDAQRALGQLALAPGGFPVAEVDALVDGADPWAAVEALVDASLVKVSDAGRCEMLASVREYASNTLDPEARAATERRLDAWLLGLPAEAASLSPELGNLLAMAPRAAARGDLEAAAHLALRVVTAAERAGPLLPPAELCAAIADKGPPAELAADLRLLAARCASRAGGWAVAGRQLEPIAQDPRHGREARALLAHAARNLGNRAEAAARLAALEAEPSDGDAPVVSARIAFLRGLLAGDHMAIEEACRHLREAAAHWVVAGLDFESVPALIGLANLTAGLGEHAEAARWLAAARTIAERDGHPRSRGLVANATGLGLVEQGRAEDALPYLHQAHDIALADGRADARAVASTNIVFAHLVAGHWAEAERYALEALPWSDGAKHLAARGYLLTYLARARFEQGDLDGALVHGRAAVAALRSSSTAHLEVEPLALLGLVLARQGRREEAAQALADAKRAEVTTDRRPAKVRHLALRAMAYLSLGEGDSALCALEEAEGFARGLPPGVDGMRLLARARAKFGEAAPNFST